MTGAAFAGPSDIRFEINQLFVSNFFGGSVDSVAPDGTGMGPFTSGGPGILGTTSFAFGPDGNLYVASFNGGTVQRYDGATGIFIDTFASGMPGATGLVFDSDGKLWVAALFTHEVYQFAANGDLITSFSTGADTFPSHILISPNDEDELLISLTGAAGVFRFSTSGVPAGPFIFGGGLTVPGQAFLVDTFLLGDLNGDGVVNLLDVAPFVAAIVNGTFIPEADINGDGHVDLLDVQPFVQLLVGG
jgi:outer membrane protein assembly factor BamB